MILTLTIKMEAESKGELIDSFAAQVKAFQAMLTEGIAKNGFAGIPPEKVTTRFLVVGGRYAVTQVDKESSDG